MFEEERIGEIIRQLKNLISGEKKDLDCFTMTESSGKSGPETGDNSLLWGNIKHGQHWGGHNRYFLFRGNVKIPVSMNGRRVRFCLLTGREGEWDATNPQFTVYVNGKLRQGFDVNHTSIVLSDNAKPGDSFDIFLSSFTGIQNYNLDFLPSLETEDVEISGLYYDLKTLYDTIRILEVTDDNYRTILRDLTEAANMLDLRRPYSDGFYKGVSSAREYIRKKYYSDRKKGIPTVCCVGHTHIDVAWLWTTRVTRDKAVRSFSTALELMERYPDFTFMSSQPQLYKYVKEEAPEIYERIKERISQGRWEAEGGMFLEPDCNLTSGESLIRQFVYGKKYFESEFGTDSKILWLPDVFGYSAALPQIMKKCGIDYFMTTKISWNEVNELPYDTFYWKGIDGTKVLSYFVTTRDYVSKSRDTKTSNEFCTEISTNYNGYINPSEMAGAWQRYQQKDLSDDVLCSYGYGDGGGGPTEEMIETESRMEYGIPGCPATSNSSALGFFRKLEKNIRGKNVPVWSGELYLEYHRGTYTSMAENKRNNRKGEFMLENLETLGVISGTTGADYPKDKVDECWEIVMRNQFHDILPGSAVKEAYDDSRNEYAAVYDICGKITAEFRKSISEKLCGIYIFNPSGISVSGIAETDSEDAADASCQKSHGGRYLLFAKPVPARGFARAVKPEFDESVSISGNTVVTPYAEIKFNECGQITSWFDRKNNRQVLKPGSRGNVLRAFDDRPHKFDNWNIFDYYREIYWDINELVSMETVENGPLRYGIRFTWKYLDSTVSETLYFYPFTPRVDFCFSAEWVESQTLLKVLFPLDINTDEATYDIQYGNVTRKTHRNTSWDTARFETCMHKWADVSEGGFGVSFINDCKYGVSIEENEVGLSLIKCGNYPNPEADRGHHEAVYCMFPHKGTWKEAGTVNEAYLINNPLEIFSGNAAEDSISTEPFISADMDNIVAEVVKPAENMTGTVVRLYEYMNIRSNVSFKLNSSHREVWLCDMLENRERLLAEDTDEFSMEIKPYEISTLLIL